MDRDPTLQEAWDDLKWAVLEELHPLGRLLDRAITWWYDRRCFLCRERRYNHPHGRTRGCWRG